MDRRDSLEDTADNLDVPVVEVPEYPGWRREAELLTTVGKSILSDTKTYGAHLANITRGERRMKWGLSDLGDAIREIAEERIERTAREQPIEQPATGATGTNWQKMPAWGPVPSSVRTSAVWSHRTPRRPAARVWKRRSPGCAAPWGGKIARGYGQRRTCWRAQNRWEELRQDWNREVEHAEQAGIHVVYTRDYEYLRRHLKSMAYDTHMGAQLRPAIPDALVQLDKAEASRQHIEKYRDFDRGGFGPTSRQAGGQSAGQGVTVPEHKDYGIWRAAIDQTMDIGERIVANRGADNIHFAGVALREKVSERRSRERARRCATTTADLEGRETGAPGRAGRNSEGRLRPHSRRSRGA